MATRQEVDAIFQELFGHKPLGTYWYDKVDKSGDSYTLESLKTAIINGIQDGSADAAAYERYLNSNNTDNSNNNTGNNSNNNTGNNIINPNTNNTESNNSYVDKIFLDLFGHLPTGTHWYDAINNPESGINVSNLRSSIIKGIQEGSPDEAAYERYLNNRNNNNNNTGNNNNVVNPNNNNSNNNNNNNNNIVDPNNNNNTESNRDEVIAAFNMFFDRDPLPEGLEHYVNSGLTGDELLNAIVQGAYDNPNPNPDDIAAIDKRKDEITSLFRTLFGRVPEEDGLNYYLYSGKTGNDLIAAMLNGAKGDDRPGGDDPNFDMDGYIKAMQEWVGGTGIFNDTTGGLLVDGPGEYEQSPGYQFRLDEGEKAIQRGAAAKGNLLGGATQKALLRYGQDYATNDYDNFLSRYYDSLNPWLSLAGAGQVSANNSSSIANQFGSSVANNLSNLGANNSNIITQGNSLINSNTTAAGNAAAAGGINAANAWGSIPTNAINAYSAWKYFNPTVAAPAAVPPAVPLTVV